MKDDKFNICNKQYENNENEKGVLQVVSSGEEEDRLIWIVWLVNDFIKGGNFIKTSTVQQFIHTKQWCKQLLCAIVQQNKL